MKQELQNELFQILRKYGLIIIGYALFSRVASKFFINIFNSLEILNNNTWQNSILDSVIIIMVNLTVWLLMLPDVDQSSKLKWLLFGITLLNPWMGVAFIVIYSAFNLLASAKV